MSPKPAAKAQDKEATQLNAEQAAQLAAFEKLGKQGREIVSDRTKLQLSLGKGVVARLVAIKTGGKVEVVRGVEQDNRYPIYELDTADGENLFLLGAGNMEQKISGSLVGNVIGIFEAGTQDIGKASPMRVFRVIDFGKDFPDGDLPF